jgi:hypothetical protein
VSVIIVVKNQKENIILLNKNGVGNLNVVVVVKVLDGIIGKIGLASRTIDVIFNYNKKIKI